MVAQLAQEEGSGMRYRRVNETPNQPQRDPSAAEKSAIAVSDAIRRQLTTPGSVTPDEQLRLLLADRAAHTGGAQVTPGDPDP